MVVKNSLKSETIESLSYKLSQIDTNMFYAYSNIISNLYVADAKTAWNSNKLKLK